MPYQYATRITPGNSSIRKAIDPFETLPPVVLTRREKFNPFEHLSSFKTPSFGFDIKDQQGNRVGDMQLSEHPVSKNLHFSMIRTRPEALGYENGMGMATYVLAIEMAAAEGRGFMPDKMVSPEAKKIWECLIGAGVVEVRQPFRFVEDLSSSGELAEYAGDMYIPPPDVLPTYLD